MLTVSYYPGTAAEWRIDQHQQAYGWIGRISRCAVKGDRAAIE